MFCEGRHVEENNRQSENIHRFFPLIFHRFFVNNRWKIVLKARKPPLCAKIDPKSRLERRFLATNRFLANFWAPPGSPGPSRDDPENSQNRSFFSFMVKCAQKRARAVSGRPQEGPGGPPRRPQGTILRWFLDWFCTSKTNEKKEKRVNKTSKNTKEFERTVTLIRATDELSIHIYIYTCIDTYPCSNWR